MDSTNASISVLCFLLCFSILCSAFDKDILATDESALLALKSRITWDLSSSHLLSNWTEGTSICSWIGVGCSRLNDRVATLNISHLGLQGTIPPHIGNLSFLKFMNLGGNNFQGQLPQEIVKLRRLAYFSFNSNNISGDIPGWFGSLPEIQNLDLGSNSFSGSLPISLFNATKLEHLNLSSNHLNGYIPEEVGNLGNLRSLYMASWHSSVESTLPPSIFNLTSLQVVDFKHNGINGDLPLDICSKLPKLTDVDLSDNQFSGQIQSRFGNCSQLETLSLSINQFSGSIPRDIGNLTSLVKLSCDYNRFQGQIPTEIGNLQRLSYLDLNSNSLSGQIPASLFNLSSLYAIILAVNNLTGSLPLNIGQQLPKLESLLVGMNELSGTIPNSISNLTRLYQLDLPTNQFTGSIPTSLGNLRFLEHFSVFDNFLITELDFLTSLTNCRNLELVNVDFNLINIPLNPSIGNFSSSLRAVHLTFCGIRGKIPHEIGNLSGLVTLGLGYNKFTGVLPLEIQNLSNLQGFSIYSNQVTGFIPNSFCNMRQLSELYLSQNQFYGHIPECFWNMTSLRKLYLDTNQLNSTLPTELGNLRDLLELDVRSNLLSGNITPAVGALRAAIHIDLSGNNFSGDIPQSIGDLSYLNWLSLARNQLQGPIPARFKNLLSLQTLNLSENILTGEIPLELENLSELKHLNLSFNHLRGRVPSKGSFLNFSQESFMSNDELCGGIPDLHFPPCIVDSPENGNKKNGSKKRRMRIVAFILAPSAALAILISVILVLWIKKQDKKTGALPQAALASSTLHERVSFYEIQGATNGFSESNLLGTGGFGRVYKGILGDGTVLAIKVFNLQLKAAFRSFKTECEVISSIRHRNLVKIVSTCSNLDFKALVLEYMPNGSLDKWLYSHNHFLDFSQRLNIMIDVASALDYLHHGYTMPIVHCDLKPSNILLDEQMTGRLTDFGISRLLGEGENMVQTMTVATIGYTAPEYGSEGLVSTSCDIYSFGILLMETFSRKKPTDELFGEEWGLKEMITDGLHNSTTYFIDQNLLNPEDKNSKVKVRCIVSLMELALNCAAESSEKRFHASDVIVQLQKIKLTFLSNSE